MTLEITAQYVIYQSQSVLLRLGFEIAQSRSLTKPDILAKIQRATKIRLWLKALNDSFIDRPTQERIWYQLMSIGELNSLPYFPSLTTNQPPTILFGLPGATGATGATGLTGGGVAFSASNVGTDTVVDSFDVSLSTAAEWSYEIFDGTNKRVERLTGGWQGGVAVDDGGLATTDIGSTSPVSFGTNISGSTVQLIAFVSSGVWTIRGTRQLIPVSGNGVTLPTSLADGKIWIGDNTNQPAAQTLSGDITISDTGVTTIAASSIVNSKVSASAAIAVSKLAPLTASKAVVSDSNGFLTTSVTAASKVDYLANVTSDIQTQINAIAAPGTITGAITGYVTANATPSLAIVSNVLGKLTTALTTSTEIGYLSGVTSAVQPQIDSLQSQTTSLQTQANSLQTQVDTKVAKAGDTMSGNLAMGANKVTGLAASTSNGDAVRYEQIQRSSTNGVVRSLGSGFQPSSTGDSLVNYTVQIFRDSGASSSDTSISLQTSPDNSAYTTIGVVSVLQIFSGTSNPNSITINGQLTAYVPIGYYVKLVTNGAGVFTYITGQETVFNN